MLLPHLALFKNDHVYSWMLSDKVFHTFDACIKFSLGCPTKQVAVCVNKITTFPGRDPGNHVQIEKLGVNNSSHIRIGLHPADESHCSYIETPHWFAEILYHAGDFWIVAEKGEDIGKY